MNMRVPSHDAAVEQAVLGAVLLEPSCIETVSKTLTRESFYVEAHGRIFAAIAAIAAAAAALMAGELASNSHGFKMIASTRCATKLSTW